VEEKTGCDFVSGHPGQMHACGHDVHMAILTGLIQKTALELPEANLLFLFQPAEEGKGGAISILEEGLIQQYPLRAAIALHVASGLPVGTISSVAGIFFGIPQEFDVKFYGKSAHVAFPEQGIDALDAGIRFMNAIQADLDELGQTERIICHIGRLQAGSIRNIIADSCILEGTHRSLNNKARDRMNEILRHHAAQIAAHTGTRSEVDLLCDYDPVVNNAALVQQLEAVTAMQGYTYEPGETVMTGEDFGFFTTLYPGLLFWLGSGNEHPLHSELFLPSDECIEVGINTLWGMANTDIPVS
jgi:N-acetyldiaminopimelate deacetylase